MRTVFFASVVAVALVVVAFVPLLGTASPLEFGHTWGTNANEVATGVVVDASGNIIIAGMQMNPATYEEHGFLAKFTPSGSLVWNRVFASPQNASIDLSLASGGDVYVLGEQTTSFPVPGPNGTINSTITSASVARISASGSIVFYENLTELSYGLRIATDPVTDGFVIVGRGPSTVDPVVASFSSSGALRWARDGPAGLADPVSVAVDGLGRVYVLINHNNGNSAVDAFDNNGALLGQVQIGSSYPNYAFPNDLAVTSSGPAVLGFSNNGLILSQLTASLGASWTETVQASGWYTYPTRLVALSDGSLALLSNAYSSVNGTSAVHLDHMSSSGAALSGSSYVGPAEAQGLGNGLSFAAGAPLPNGGIVLAGTTVGVMPTTFTAVSLSTAPYGVSWSPDSMSWSPMNVTANPMSATLLSPTVPVDNWNEVAGEQAWWGETNLPASKLSVTVKASQSSPSSTTAALSASVTGGKKPYVYAWSFGDGASGTGASPSHTYPGAGQYLAQVTVTDTAGDVGYGSVVVTVTGPPAVLYIDHFPPGPVYSNTQVNFYAGAVDPDGGTITSYQWSFGDGVVDVTPYSSDYHFYAVAGNYTLILTVTDSDQGLSASMSLNVTVVPRPDQPPVASFYWSPYFPTVGSTVAFYGYFSFDPDGYITNFLWSFGDGTLQSGNGSCCTTHVYANPGNYTVSLTVTDNAGLNGTENQTIIVVPDQPPVADFFWYPQVPSVNDYVSFSAGYTSYDPDGYIVSWVWDFGDGTTGGGNGTGNGTGNNTNLGPFPYHQYTTFGTFEVTLTVTDNGGLSTSITKSIFVNAPPIASFTPSSAVGKAGTAVTFNASASTDPDGDPLNFTWAFGDGSSATGSIVSHIFAVPGQYLVTLVVSDPYTSRYQQMYFPVIVPKTPAAILAWSPTHPVAGQTTVAFDGSNSLDPDGAITQYIWEFGDGTVGHGKTTTHVYASAGTYTLELVVLDEDGMWSRDVQTITVVGTSKGTVTTAGLRAPASMATVTLTDQGAVALVLTTAADGSFSLGGLAPGTYGLTITLAGYAPYAGSLVWDGIHGELGTFVLTPLPPVSSGVFGIVGSPAIVLGIVAAIVAGVGAAALVHRRRVGGTRKPPSP